jgi:hypothetical protein
MYKTLNLDYTEIETIVGAIANNYSGQIAIVPAAKRGMSNATIDSGSGEYDGGDRVIGGSEAFEIDGDLLFTVGWGDGFAARRLNNDGTMTKLFHDTQFLWRDTSSTYNHLQSCSIDKINKKGVVMTYNVEGYTTFDYSGLMNGGTTFVKDPRPTHNLPDVFIGHADIANGYVNRVGAAYFAGHSSAGEWVYAADHDSHHYYKVMRRNLRTGVEERLDSRTSEVMYPGSAVVDRAGYRGWNFYDEHNDRILYGFYYNGNFIMVVDASTANPKTVWCDMSDAGLGDDGYEQGFFVPDPVAAPNVISVGTNSSHSYIDITPCFSGNTATVLQRIYTEGQNPGNNYGNYFRAGTKYQAVPVNGQPTDKMIGYPNFHPTTADRGKAMIPGWVDRDNSRMVALIRYNNTKEDTTTGGRGRSWRCDYGCNITRMYSANGTPWWVQMGYGYDGHGFTIWNDTYRNELIPNWSVTYKTKMLANSANINFVFWSRVDYFTPSGTTLSFFVSNNNGESFENYTGTETGEHNFSSTGNQLICKVSASGDVSKNAYKMSSTLDSITFGTKYASEMDSSIKNKFTRIKLKGKK